MGTRGLTCVIMGGAMCVAQYGQWDHYPSGQGQTILDFLNGKPDRKYVLGTMSGPVPARQLAGVTRTASYADRDEVAVTLSGFDLEHFKSQLGKCRFGTEAEFEAIYDQYSNNGMMSLQQSDDFKRAGYAYLSRDCAAAVLPFIYSTDREEIVLQDERAFAAESLHCEWGYVVDLDNQVLEVYRGFQTTPPAQDERFAKASDTVPPDWRPLYQGAEYYFPIQLRNTFPFSYLATLTELPEDTGYTPAEWAEHQAEMAET